MSYHGLHSTYDMSFSMYYILFLHIRYRIVHTMYYILHIIYTVLYVPHTVYYLYCMAGASSTVAAPCRTGAEPEAGEPAAGGGSRAWGASELFGSGY